ncbi:MAG: hypothetical protein WDM87_13670 [Terracidiphilus sp.]
MESLTIVCHNQSTYAAYLTESWLLVPGWGRLEVGGMARLFIRVELRGEPSGKDYDNLHAYMEGKNWRRKIASTAGRERASACDVSG